MSPNEMLIRVRMKRKKFQEMKRLNSICNIMIVIQESRKDQDKRDTVEQRVVIEWDKNKNIFRCIIGP
jgi:hypothetical protein